MKLLIALLFSATLQAQIPRTTQFNVVDYGANGADNLDDAQAIQSAFNAASAVHGTVIIPSPSNYYRINSTILVAPSSGNEVTVNVIAQGTPRKQFKYFGASGTACFSINGLRFSKWDNVSVFLSDTVNTIAFDLDTKLASSSFSFNVFTNCNAVLGNITGQRGWRIGHTSANGGDISNLSWIGCMVYGNRPTAQSGSIGWQFEGSNTLANALFNCFTAFCNKGWTNVEGAGASTGGNGAIYFFSCHTSQNQIDFEIQNTQNVTIKGGRFESGLLFLKVPWNNKNPVIQVEGAEINDYHPSDGRLVFLEMPCTLSWRDVSVKGRSVWSPEMFRLSGGQYGLTTAVGSLIIEGGTIQTNSDSVHVTPTTTKWRVYRRGVGKMNSDGVKFGFLEDIVAY